jgi:putative SOS response-associated peptidase YedK
MCGRFTLRTPASLLATWFQRVDFTVTVPRYNIAPTQRILALRERAPSERAPGERALSEQARREPNRLEQGLPKHEHGQLEAVMLRWGLIPSWAKDIKIGNQMINARSETAASKPAFRRAFKSQRCIILADGFYEWKPMSGGKQPFLIQPGNNVRPLFCFAGLWESWRPSGKPPAAAPSGASDSRKREHQRGLFDHAESSVVSEKPPESDLLETCTILTTSANSLMSTLHDRMPVILDEPSQALWLANDFQDLDRLNSLLAPCPNAWLRLNPVSRLVNKPSEDSAACAEPIELAQDD